MLHRVTRGFLLEEAREIAHSGDGARSLTQSFYLGLHMLTYKGITLPLILRVPERIGIKE